MPIETRYAGCRFRSRLEARWAVWFDHLGINWQYETETYLVGPKGSQRGYLPDFYLPRRALWVEVKGHVAAANYPLLVAAAHPEHGLPISLGTTPDDFAYFKQRLLVLGPVPRTAGFHLSLLLIGGVLSEQLVTPICKSPQGRNDEHDHLMSPVLGPRRVEPNSDGEYVPPPCMLDERGYGFPCPDISAAYTAARSARFEHGEQG
ncbi:hypothetical protein ABT336_12130 [Micromonospora sp. NPDC000207]|uniref:hypothetical protein n=1 Tax=Micromonospora sp. NPDC000207 TaxID=3154246 RepID=UPI00333229E5